MYNKINNGEYKIPSSLIECSIPELGEVNTKSLKFKKMFIVEWIRYTPFFFIHAPIKKWYDYFGSCYRVSLDCTRGKIALENESNIWNRNVLRNKFLHYFKHVKNVVY